MATEVSSYARDTQPYSDIGLIWVTFPDGYQAAGTCSLVGRNDILTATHVVYSPDHGGWANSFDFYFGADYNDITYRFEDYGYSYSPTEWLTNAWPDQAFTDSNNETMIQSEVQYDISIIGVNTPIGDTLGWLGIDPGYNGNYLANSVGYPAGETGMMQETVSVNESPYYGLYESDDDVMGPGSSGGPLLIGDYVIGVKSTGGWWADVGFLFNSLVDVMAENDSLLSPPLVDDTNPTVSTFSPTDGATGVSTTSNIVLTFSEAIQQGTGSIALKTAAGTTIETFNAASSNRLSISGETLTIDPTNTLDNGTDYYVTFAPGTIEDLAGNDYIGTTTYDFTTERVLTYATIDYLPDLTFSQMEGAGTLNFTPYAVSDWDYHAEVYGSEQYALLHAIYKFDAIAGATYDFFSTSYFDPYILLVYDKFGNTISANGESDDPADSYLSDGGYYSEDVIWDWVAPYTGTYYVDASWNQGSYYDFYSLSIYEDIDTATNIGQIINGTTADETLSGTAGGDAIYGWDGADNLFGEDGDDFLSGGDGDDSLEGGPGDDTIDGGNGIDAAVYLWDASGVSVNLALGSATGAGADTLTGIENVYGSNFSDVLIGDEGDNYLLGGSGDDVISGGDGNDLLEGGAGNDSLDGGAGTQDCAVFSSAVTVNLALGTVTGEGVDTLTGIEAVIGSDYDDTLIGDIGSNLLIGGTGNDSLDGGAGLDTAIFSGDLSDCTISKTSSGYTLTSGSGGTDMLTNVEQLQFDDMSINLTVQAIAATVDSAAVQRIEELYVAFFNRVPDADGLEYWLTGFNNGASLDTIAESFYNAGVFYSDLTGYSAGMSPEDFVNTVYRNVLGRADGADAEGLAYWSAAITNGGETHGSLVSTILDAAHTYKGDPTWGWVPDLLDNKIQVADQFAVDWGLNYNTPEESIANGMAIAAAVTPTDTDAALSLIGVSDLQIDLFVVN
jgi:Ca2+-binding RTX toxin-like protein/V8-like Glu-specific endopeptidase